MKAEELRIGNLVDVINRSGEIHLPMGTVKRVGQLQFFEVHLYEAHKPFANLETPQSTNIRDIAPIPLTEEWLLKFGFEANNEGIFYNSKYLLTREKFNQIEFFQLHKSRTIDFGAASLCGIQYVHELQNVLYCLTGEELTIKL